MKTNKENLTAQIRFRMTPDFKNKVEDHFRHSPIPLSKALRNYLSDQIKPERKNANNEIKKFVEFLSEYHDLDLPDKLVSQYLKYNKRTKDQ